MPTSHDVARLAGVSQSTVSRALRGEAGIAAATVARVQAAAEALNYAPSETGRALSTRRTWSVGIFAGELTNPFYPELVEPVRHFLAEKGYRSILLDDLPTKERIVHGVMDGAIVTSAVTGCSVVSQLVEAQMPFVLANRTLDAVVADACHADNETGGALAARFLLELGHTRISALFGPRDTSTGREREHGFRTELAKVGMTLPAHLGAHCDFTEREGHAAAMRLLDLSEPPTAIFCANDVVAFGALNAARDARREVGKNLTVIGFDDIAMSAWQTIGLTTIGYDFALMAEQSVSLLDRRITDPSADSRIDVLPVRVIERGTHHRPGAQNAGSELQQGNAFGERGRAH